MSIIQTIIPWGYQPGKKFRVILRVILRIFVAPRPLLKAYLTRGIRKAATSTRRHSSATESVPYKETKGIQRMQSDTPNTEKQRQPRPSLAGHRRQLPRRRPGGTRGRLCLDQ